MEAIHNNVYERILFPLFSVFIFVNGRIGFPEPGVEA
jgi:hypothetical protein